MSFSLPYSKKRRYLTGIDWSVGTLDYITKQQTGVGNLSQVVLELEGWPDEARLRGLLGEISARLPLLHGQVARDWVNLAPYWKVPASADRALIPLEIADATSAQEAEGLLADHVNTPLVGETQHLRFLLVRGEAKQSWLGMVFDHRLLDAFGAEAFLLLIEEAYQGRLEQVARQVKQTEPAHLDQWGQRFSCGKTVNRFRVRLSEREVAALPMPPRQPGRPVRFVHDSLSPEQAARFTQLAQDESGVPLLLPSAIARAVGAMHVALARAPLAGTQYLMAVSVDGRAIEQKWEQLLFNHLSFLGFSAPVEQADRPGELAILLRDQFFEQMKEGIPAALQDITMLTRICPHRIGSKVAQMPFKGRGSSFYFACLRESVFTSASFMGLRAVNLIHTPRVPPPPGMGICLTFFAGRMNMVLSYLEGTLDDATARQVMGKLRTLMAV